ncbi:guanine nucleotide-binding protein alpha-4 subunit [Mycena alexandri]|uniref:Guanine nucleotide-binding protein alpha-4 subunit n=1 Tax=Mycena alexandri TaxID=1745969 RepID=A0AAD6S117_9AGAR|nr:guanine nucleotide-binding protein alpha-4 subunit [Mycena alexandri]
MTVVSDIDPLTLALQPPPDETPEAREARLQREREAKKRSDLIDEELNRQRNAEKSVKSVKILLLGQSESGKSTTLKNFQLINSPKAFKAERASWRVVVHLNVVRSIHLILDALTAAEVFAAHPRPYSPDNPVYPALTPELLGLKLRLIPLQQVEIALLGKLSPHATLKNEAPGEVSSAAEVSVHSAMPWKTAFSRLLNNVRGSLDGLEANEPQECREARQILHASSEYMICLWNDPIVKEVLKAHHLLSGSPPARFVRSFYNSFLDAIQRVTSLSYEPTNDDILRARLKTLGVSEHQFSLKTGNMVPHNWIVYDVGGARSVPYFDHMQAIIFLAPLSCFDQVLAEDDRVNRLEDSMLLWKIIVSSPLLKNSNLILFLNKCDILRTKLTSGIKLSDYVTSYADRPNDFENCSQCEYLKKKFAGIVKNYSPSSRAYYSYFTSVIVSRCFLRW